MKIYLAGPMRGIPYFNFPAFFEAAAKLRAEGHEVFCPAESDIDHHGTDISAGNHTGDEAQAASEHRFTIREAMKRDTAYILDHAEAIALLPGWEKSKGVGVELALARLIGLKEIVL